MQPPIAHDLQRYLNQHWKQAGAEYVAREVRCVPDGNEWFRCRARVRNRKTGVVTCIEAVVMEGAPGEFALFGRARRVACKSGPL